jgi:hypothetical protein
MAVEGMHAGEGGALTKTNIKITFYFGALNFSTKLILISISF